MTKTQFFTLVICLVPVILLFAIFKNSNKLIQPRTKTRLSELKLTARRPLTTYEEKMFRVLTEALPECRVLAQVSLQALLDTPRMADRNRFNRKIADFLVCSKNLTPIAVIELDDASHNRKTSQDADRDAMLRNAGYQTIRYRNIPTCEQIHGDIENSLKLLTRNVTSHDKSPQSIASTL